MSSPSGEKSAHERWLDEVVTAYLKDVERGQAPNQAEWLARHPDLADELAEFFATQEHVDRLAAPLRRSPLTANDAPTIGPGDAPAPGTRVGYFGDYELLEEIGRGGMGVVYKARQVSLKRVVALKMILRGQLANPDEVHRFRVEAEAAAKLVHPGIVPVFEVGTYEGHHYFTMAFVDGESLAYRLTRGLLPPREAAEMTRKVAVAVAYAHTEGVIHRDLKPANILLDRESQPHLTDFGLAKRVQADTGMSAAGLTATGQILGTPSYMPPEQASGARGAVGPVADVYSLGAVLYCLVTGRPPFQADNPFDTLLQVLEEEPVSPRQLNAKVPRDLETICLKCLEKDPKKRYGSAQELTADLERFLAGQPIRARPVGLAGRAGRWCRRNPVVAALTATTAAALVAGSVVSTLFGIESASSAKDAMAAAARADIESGRAKTAAELEAKRAQTEARAKEYAELLLYVSRINLAHNEWRIGNVDRALKLLDDCDAARRGWEWHYLARLEHGAAARLTGHDSSVGPLSASPDGARLAGVSIDGSVYVWDAGGKLVQRFRGHRDVPSCVRFSPDGQRIASGSKTFYGFSNRPSSGEAIVWDPQTGNAIVTVGREHLGVTCVAFSPDGQRLATVGNDGTLRVWSIPKGEQLAMIDVPGVQGVEFFDGDDVLIRGSNGVRRLALADPKSGWELKSESLACVCPTGKLVVTAGDGDSVTLRDPADGKSLAVLRGMPDGVRSFAINRSGTLLAAGGAAGQVKLWDLAAREEIAVFRERQPWIDGVAFLGDDRSLAIAAGNPLFEILGSLFTGKEAPPPDPVKIRSVLGQESASIRHKRPASPVALRAAADKREIWLASEHAVTLYDPAGAEALRRWEIDAGSVTSLAASHDGKTLAVALTFKAEKETAEGYLVKLVDAATGKDVRELGWVSAPATALAFSPDDVTLAVSGSDERTTLWDVVAGVKRATLSGDSGGMSRLEFSRDGKTLYRLTRGMVSIGNVQPTHFRPGLLETWDVDAHRLIRGMHPTKELCENLALRGDGAELAVVDGAGVLLLDPATGDVRRSIAAPNVRQLAYHPDGRRLALLDRHGVRLWDTEANQELLALRGTFDHIAVTADGQFLVTANSRGVQVWDGRPTSIETPAAAKQSAPKKEPPPDSRPEAVIQAVRRATALLDKGDSLAALPWLVEALRKDPDPGRKTIHRWRIGLTLQDIPQLRPVMSDGKAARFAFDKIVNLPLTPDFSDPIEDSRLDPLLSLDAGRIAFSTQRRADKRVEWDIELCDAATGKVISSAIHPLPRYSGRMYAFSAAGGHFASFEKAEDGDKSPTIRVRDAQTGKPVGPPIRLQLAEKDWDEVGLSLSPDGRHALVRESWGRRTRVFDAATGEPLVLPQPYDQAYFSADGKLILTAESDRRTNQSASVWNVDTRQLISRIYIGELHDACFSADGKRVLLAHDSYCLSAWDVATAKPLHKRIVVPHGARALAFDSDGRRFAAAFERDKQQVRIWDTETGDALSPPLPLPSSSACRLIQFLGEGRVLLTATDDEVRFWDAHTGEPMSVPIKVSLDRFGRGQPIVQLSPDGGTLHVRESDRSTSFAIRKMMPPADADWDLLARALSGQRLVDGTATSIPAAELLALRERARGQFPERFGTPVNSDKEVRVHRDAGRLPLLLAIARDTAASVERRQQAVAQIGMLGDASALPMLVELLLSDAAVEIRAAAATAVGRSDVPQPEALSALAKAMREKKSRQLRQAAVLALRTETLASAGSAILVEALRSDADPYVRGQAVKALRAIVAPDAAVLRGLRDALTDAAGSVRVEAAAALLKFDPDSDEPATLVVAAVQGADENAQSAALKHIGRLGEKARPAVPAMAELVAKNRVQTHFREPTWYALRAITQLGPVADAAVPSLIARLGDDDSDPRTTDTATGYVRPDRCPITFALAHIGPAALPELKRILESGEKSRPRLQAALAIGFMGPRAASALPDLERLQQRLADPRRRPRDGDEDLRAAVNLAIANLHRPGTSPPPVVFERD